MSAFAVVKRKQREREERAPTHGGCADCECGERAPRTPKKAKSGKASAKEENPAAEPAVTPQKGKKGASK